MIVARPTAPQDMPSRDKPQAVPAETILSAATRGDAALLRSLGQDDVLAKDADGRSAAHVAAGHGHAADFSSQT